MRLVDLGRIAIWLLATLTISLGSALVWGLGPALIANGLCILFLICIMDYVRK